MHMFHYEGEEFPDRKTFVGDSDGIFYTVRLPGNGKWWLICGGHSGDCYGTFTENLAEAFAENLNRIANRTQG